MKHSIWSRIPFVMLGCFLFSRCDPMRRINMRNRSDSTVRITWSIREDSIHVSPFYLSNSKELSFTLEPHGPSRNISLSCGIGIWTPKDLRNVLDDLDSFSIRKGSEIKTFRGTNEMMQFLLTKRKGLDRGKLELRIQ